MCETKYHEGKFVQLATRLSWDIASVPDARLGERKQAAVTNVQHGRLLLPLLHSRTRLLSVVLVCEC
jgi:hypothetical protein